MLKSPVKTYFAAPVFIVLLASFSFAGEDQCPADPPPPPEGEFVSGASGAAFSDNYLSLNDFLRIVDLPVNIF